jgi:futalosine hydrolase
MRLLVVTSVPAEAEAIGFIAAPPKSSVIVSGIGRTNAAAATTEALIRAAVGREPFGAVLSAGVAGALPAPGGRAAIGQVILASVSVYMEEGLMTPRGFVNTAAMGFPLGDFEGNGVPADEGLLDRLGAHFRTDVIATVATCSGTDAAAAEVARRTGAAAEAMEGAAVVHAARRLRVPAIELRAISNTTGDRSRQVWDLATGLRALGEGVRTAAAALVPVET